MPRRTGCAVLAITVVLGLAHAGCTHVTTSPRPDGVRSIAIFPVDNRTGSALFADAPPLLSLLRDVPAHRVTVPELLATELARVLAERGFEVVTADRLANAPGANEVRDVAGAARLLESLGIDASPLWIELWRWDPDDPSHLTYVDVKLDATLADPDGRVIWHAHWPARPVAAGGASSVALGYPEVVRRVVQATVADLSPSPLTTRP